MEILKTQCANVWTYFHIGTSLSIIVCLTCHLKELKFGSVNLSAVFESIIP